MSGRRRTFPNGQERYAAGRSGVAKLELVGSQRRNYSFLVGNSLTDITLLASSIEYVP